MFSENDVALNIPSKSNRAGTALKYRRPPEFVQHFAYRGNSHWRKGAARNIIDMVWLNSSLIWWGGGGYLLVQIFSSCLRSA